MNHEILKSFILCVLEIIFLSVIVSKRLIDVVLKISKIKNLYADSMGRGSHTGNISNLGGVVFFASFFFSLLFFKISIFDPVDYIYIFLGVFVLFFLGLNDDLIGVSAYSKLLVQVVISLYTILLMDRLPVEIDIFISPVLNYFFAVVICICYFVFVINSFNLIDGIDGLAGSIAVVILSLCAVTFIIVHIFFLALICFSLLSTVAVFLYYNFSIKRKIFMGDNGSLVLGYLIAFFVCLSFSEIERASNIEKYSILYLIYGVIAAFLSYQYIDTIRVVFVRVIRQNKSPFSADKGHLHHKLVAMGFNHCAVTSIIVSILLLLSMLYNFTGISGYIFYFAPFLVIGLCFFYYVRDFFSRFFRLAKV